MLAAYKDVGNNFQVVQGRLERGLAALQGFESVPRRWPLAQTNGTIFEQCGLHWRTCWMLLGGSHH